MAELLKGCPVCGQENFTTFLNGKDYFLSQEKFNILKCQNCGFMVTDPIPGPGEIGKYYESSEYISHDAGEKKLINLVYKTARFFTLRSKFRIIKKYSPGKKLLDIGCGTGEFLNYCKSNGYACSGIEPNPKAREFAIKKYGLPVDGDISGIDKVTGSYDCITMWHVLEHIHDLDGTFLKLKSALKPGATLILALPNPSSWDAKYYGEYWAAFDMPRHLYHFSSHHISMLADKHGFSLKKILPQRLDAFYISLLSEKYRSGKKDPVRGFFNGLRSNLAAKDPAKGYSSHIYILSANFS